MFPGSNFLQSVSRRQVFHIAWPIILSNLSTPLLGLVDTAVIGNLGDPALIGAIAIGGMIFSFLYWGFGFLRMGTTGLVAQARGARNLTETKASFYRAFLIGLLIGSLMLMLQYPIITGALHIIGGSEYVEAEALSYFQVRIWGAPISLAHLAIMGFLLGLQDTRSLLLLQIVLNGTNIILDFVFVVGFGWAVMGVAAATVISEVIAIILGLFIVTRRIHASGTSLLIPKHVLLRTRALKRMFVINMDIMIRTLCLIFCFAWFTNQGAQSGDVILSANAILMQFVSFSAFFLDGFALAAETLVGSAIGARDKTGLNRSIRFSTELGVSTALLLTFFFWLLGTPMIHLLTNAEAVRSVGTQYLIWAIVTPLLSVWCYLLDGIFIGATRTAEMRNAMIFSLATFLTGWYFLHGTFGNHGLWLAFQLYFLARAASLAFYLPRLRRMTD